MESSGAGLIVREREPLNLEFPFDCLNAFLTPNDLHYIRSHFQAPVLDRDTYTLAVNGAVRTPFSLTYAELLALPAVTCPATLECAGNSRVFLVPQVKGAQWQLGAVSTAEWTGVPLKLLLDRAGLEPGACEVVLEAADRGTPKELPVPPGKISYARSIPLAKTEDVLIAHSMNGEPVPSDHGAPIRAVVPGYYGMASVKGLTGIRIVTEPFQGYWQTSDYAYWGELEGNPVRLPLGAMSIKSAIARPRLREVVRAGEPYLVFGASWAGTEVAATELSTDNGASWQPVEFLDGPHPFAWRRWQRVWEAPSMPGTYLLRSRATDRAGRTQPEQHDPNSGTYRIHHTFPIEVVVR